jgi:CHAT domain-containing protein
VQPVAALQELAGVESVAEQRAYALLLGRVRWLRGLVRVRQGELTAGLEMYRLALKAFAELGDTESDAFLRALLAEGYGALGQDRLEWRERTAGLALLPRVRDPRRRYAILESTALACLDRHLLRAALHVQTALVEHAVRWSNPTILSDVLVKRGAMLHAVGSDDLAARDLDQARRFAARIGDPALAEAGNADADAAEGSTLVRREPERAVRLLRRALLHYERALQVRVPGLRLLVARAQASRGLTREAEAELLAGIRLVEAQRVSLHDLALQASFFEEALPLFDDMVALQVDERQDPSAALSFVERGRARQLADSLAAARPPERPRGPVVDEASFAPAALQRELPEGVALVYYVCLERRLLAWRLTRDDLRLVEQPVPEAEVARLAAAQRVALERRAPLAMVRAAGGRLYDVLVRPLAIDHASARALVIVPDAALHSVSFAALWDAGAGRYLAEDYLLGVSPSGNVLVRHSRDPGSLPPRPHALVVGDPRVDPALWPELVALPGAQREAAEVAALHTAPELLAGAAATRAAFLDGLGRSDVVHYAGHASAVADDPSRARLVFAPDPDTGDSGALDLRDLPPRSLRARLVVLAACRSAAGAVSRLEGAFSLSRPFLAAGVPNVVGSLWDVDDEVSRTFFVTFHRSLRVEGEPAAALRATQVVLLRDGDPTLAHPSTWAGFVSIGALRAPTR